MIRELRPTDLLALAHFHRRAAANLARSRDLLAMSQSDPGTASLLLADWRFPARRQTWVATDRHRLIGLVSTRRGAVRQSWEIDRLLLPPDARMEAVCQSLLAEISLACAHQGIERLYLRLPVDHPVLTSAQRAGFVHYAEELVMRLEGALPAQAVPPGNLRRRDPADDHAVYRLYNLSVPTRVRQSEAVTYQEWLALQRLARTQRSEQWVVDAGASLVAWFRVARQRQAGLIEALYLPETEAKLATYLDFVLGRLAGESRVWGLVPHFQPALARHLQARGFDEVGRSAVFVKHLAVRVRAPRLVPARA